MCGIVGLIGDFRRQECLDIVKRMSDAIVHRGPDDHGAWCEDGFGFAVRRLSIIDFQGGHQPMWDKESDLGVIFNGEIYNYRDVREDLLACGQAFHTHSDTEVVLQSLARKGLDAVHGWNGMFAVAAWDGQAKRLFLLRDRIGIKPLYYFWDGVTFLFASEIKAILASGIVKPRVNQQTVWDYLTFRHVSSPETIWEGIKKLPPGHTLEVTAGSGPKVACYWKTDVVESKSLQRKTESELDREFEDLFLDAIQLRFTASDVPIGLLLSGGLDSSAIAAAAAELGYRNLHTFSVGFEDGGYYSELPYARQVAQHVGSNHHEIVIGQKEFLELLPEVVYYLDEPLADLSAVPLLAVSRLARKHVKAVLSGDGCDEIFAGYEDMALDERKWELVRSLQSLPRPLLTMAASFAAVLPNTLRRKIRRVANVPLSNWYQRDYPNMTRLLNQLQKTELWPGVQGQDSERLLAALYSEAHSSEPLQQLLSVFQKTWLVEDLLMKLDKMSMATSVEVRSPFLDYRLVEWANQTPKSVKVKRVGILNYETKSILRRFCARRLPKEIVQRRKRGFPVPAQQWLANGLRDWAHDLLLGEDNKLGVTFSSEALSRLLTRGSRGLSRDSDYVWLLLVLESWLRVWKAELSTKPVEQVETIPLKSNALRAGMAALTIIAFQLSIASV
ncbi:MAG TPA: asparagine synthase (glutamine-hydrolyzing) [Pyrinomonadaceae bacterium]|nr:asparagine synthase (glutamine-hydrolyzing) [Pyrinomonadaceae bacterium]